MSAETRLRALLSRRIAVIDGAMGTMIQRETLDEAAYRGDRFRDHPKDLKGANDLLVLTRPDVVEKIHRAYLSAGADILETCTFNAQAISLADYGLEPVAYELNVEAARLARKAVDAHRAATGRDAFVAGALGPTNRTLSLAVDVNDPGKRTHVFDEIAAAYRDQVRGLLDGGADVLLFETVFDTLVLKAALAATLQLFDEGARRVPLMVSVTITDKSGRTLSGQMLEAFWNSIAHVPLLSVGINCALGAKEMRPYVEELSGLASAFVSAYPNAGLPNAFGGFDETPEIMCADLAGFAREGWVNIVGGCCGTTPDHIRAIAEAVKDLPPRKVPEIERRMRLSGLEPYTLREGVFTVVGERTNVTGSPRFAKCVLAGDYEGALSVARQQVEGGANVLDVCMDEGMLDGKAAMTRFLNLLSAEPDIAKLPIMLDSSKWDVIEAGLKCLQGKAVVNSLSLKEGADAFREKARLVRRYGAAVIVMAFDEDGQATTADRKVAIASRAYRTLTQEVGFPPEDVVFDPNVLTVATGIEEHEAYALDFFEATRRIKEALPHAKVSRRGFKRLVFLPRQQHGPRGDARGLPLPRDPRRPRPGDRERGPARGLRGRPEGPPGKGRGRPPEPAERRDGAARRVRRVGQDAGSRRGEDRRMAERFRRGAALTRPRPRDHGLRRRRRRGSPAEARTAAGRHRGPAHGGDERRR